MAFLNLLAIASIAIIACSLNATPVNALSVETHKLARSHAHSVMVLRKRGKRCRPRPSSSSAVVSPTPSSTKPPPANSDAPKPPPTKPDTPPSNNNPPPSPPPSNGRGKVGLAWPINDPQAFRKFVTPKVAYAYTWSPWLPQGCKDFDVECIPMLWGTKQINEFKQHVVAGYAKTVFGFNEPNQQGQSDMDPGYAASVWKDYIEPLKNQGYTLISPACTNAPSGKQWMKNFLAACTGCHVDGIALHFYGTDPKQFIDYMTDMHNTFGRNIWATEFACQNFGGGPQCDEGQVWNFMKTAKEFMNDTPWVQAYFAFGAMHDMNNVNPLNRLMNGDGSPNALGQYYIG